MRDYAALEALAAKSPRLNDMRITTPKGTLSMRSDFGLWLKRDSPQIGKPETDSMLVEVPGADFLLDLTRAVDGSVHHKSGISRWSLSATDPKHSGRLSVRSWKRCCKGNGCTSILFGTVRSGLGSWTWR